MDFSRGFLFVGRRIWIFSPDFFSFLWEKVPRKYPPGKSPAKSSKIYTTKIPDIFLQRGRANSWTLFRYTWVYCKTFQFLIGEKKEYTPKVFSALKTQVPQQAKKRFGVYQKACFQGKKKENTYTVLSAPRSQRYGCECECEF